MKRSLLFKLILCYIICVSFIFLIIETAGSTFVSISLDNYVIEELENENQIFYDNYFEPLINRTLKLSDFKKKIREYSVSTNTTMWFVSSQGKIALDTSRSIKSGYKRIDKIDPSLLESSSGKDYVLTGYIDDTSYYSVKSCKKDDSINYVIMFKKANLYEDYKSDMILKLNYIGLMICPIILLVFILIYFLTIYPVHKITKAASEYSKGHFSYPLEINANDEYHELGTAIKYMAGEMNNLDDYQRKFIGNISHDFRSPMTSIKGYIQAMIDGTIPPENQEKYLNIVLFEAERLSGLMTNLLTLNSFDHNKKALEKTNFDINYIILKTVETYVGTCEKKKIEFEFNFEQTKQLVWADQPRIQQVLNNLVDNALKFSPQYSTIEISTYNKSEKVYISIKDHGIGISSNNINRIWERFYKSDTSRGKDKKGTGLGLAITKDIITAHKESIDVISTEGVGTEFIFTLPPKHVTKL